jgi:hypothetical protein
MSHLNSFPKVGSRVTFRLYDDQIYSGTVMSFEDTVHGPIFRINRDGAAASNTVSLKQILEVTP